MFVSQWTRTVGEVSLETDAEGHEILRLTNFETGPADMLHIWLNSDFVVRGDDGYYTVEDPLGTGHQFDIGPLVSVSCDQQYDLTVLSGGLPKVRSVTIYDYGNLRAFGSANLPAMKR